MTNSLSPLALTVFPGIGRSAVQACSPAIPINHGLFPENGDRAEVLAAILSAIVEFVTRCAPHLQDAAQEALIALNSALGREEVLNQMAYLKSDFRSRRVDLMRCTSRQKCLFERLSAVEHDVVTADPIDHWVGEESLAEVFAMLSAGEKTSRCCARNWAQCLALQCTLNCIARPYAATGALLARFDVLAANSDNVARRPSAVKRLFLCRAMVEHASPNLKADTSLHCNEWKVHDAHRGENAYCASL